MSKTRPPRQVSRTQVGKNPTTEKLLAPSGTLKEIKRIAVEAQLEVAASPLGQSAGLWIGQKKPNLFLDSLDPIIFYRTSAVAQSGKNPIPLTMAVKIDPDTTLEDLKDLWPIIKSWKTYLKKIQPPIPQRGVQGIQGLGLRLYRQHTKKPKGKGYGTLAKDLNKELEALYHKAVEWEKVREEFAKWLPNFGLDSITNPQQPQFSRWLKEITAAKKKYGVQGDTMEYLDAMHKLLFPEHTDDPINMMVSSWLAQGDSVFLDGARRMLEFFNCTEMEIQDCSQDAMELLREGLGISWAKGRHAYSHPITRQRIIDYFKKLKGTTNRFQ